MNNSTLSFSWRLLIYEFGWPVPAKVMYCRLEVAGVDRLFDRSSVSLRYKAMN